MRQQFLREHPNVTILSESTNNGMERSYNVTRYFSDYGFVYRNAHGTEHEEVWHYNRSGHDRPIVKKEQIR
jgi:hypothetical protein